MKSQIHELRDAEGGFSLVESLVATAVLSIVLTGGLSMFLEAHHGLSGSGKRQDMMALAESTMEALRVIPYHQLLAPDFNGDGQADFVLADQGNGEYVVRQEVSGALLTWTVRPDQPVLSKAKAVTLSVLAEWDDSRGRRRKVEFGMRRANPTYSGGQP
jgi:prepilin-type N-terminal cleavage/methylation domain-containing protein